MFLMRWLLGVLACLAGAHAAIATPLSSETWVSINSDPVWREIKGWPSNDYMNVFRDRAAFREAFPHIKVFELTKFFILRASKEDLQRVVDTLENNGVKLAAEVPPLPTDQHSCGLGIEGYGAPDDMQRLAAKLKSVHADLAYVRMDEPLLYGHVLDGRGGKVACHTPVSLLATQAAKKMSDLKASFPNILIGDIEPVGASVSNEENWIELLKEWVKAYEDASGQKLAFVHADVVWARPLWKEQLRALQSVLREQGVPLGVIYNASRLAQSDAAWSNEVLKNATDIVSTLGHVPAQTVIETWTEWPSRVLPPSDKLTFSGVVRELSK